MDFLPLLLQGRPSNMLRIIHRNAK